MGAKGITIAEECHVVNLLVPFDVVAGATTSDWVNLENYAHVSIIIQTGSITNDTLFKIYECKDNGGAVKQFMAAEYYYEVTVGGSDSLSTRTALAVGGFQTGTEDNSYFVIEIDASELTADYTYLALLTDAPGNALLSAVAILSGSRHAGDPSKRATAL